MKPVDLLPRYFDPQPKRLSLIQRVGRILGKKESRRSCSTPTFNNEDGFMGSVLLVWCYCDDVAMHWRGEKGCLHATEESVKFQALDMRRTEGVVEIHERCSPEQPATPPIPKARGR